ncbi:MAG TPA: S41 family peptidase [Vicinamibacterales bacterium]|nr:S41 family peptidase [Vicinamibacterales bacterium]
MSSRTRLIVMTISAPVIAFAIVGGFLSKVMAREDAYPQLKIFGDVVDMISSSYVEEVNMDKVMVGAMKGLADNLDPDSAFLSAAEVRQVESGAALPPAGVGLALTRQYYLRVIAARDGSPAAKAGLRTGDYIRMIDDTATREMSVWAGMHMLRGAAGSKVKLTVIRGNAADPHIVELTRENEPVSEVTHRTVAPGVGLLRIAAIGPTTAAQVRTQAQELTRGGASKLVLDLRRTSSGTPGDGLEIARLFVANGTLAMREGKAGTRDTIAAAGGDAIAAPLAILIDTGTSAAAEVLAAALSGNKRGDLFGEHTIGRAADQKLFKLPDGSGLWLSTVRYLTPTGAALHEKGLEPTVAVDEPDVTEFGAQPPPGDPVLDKALEQLAGKKAA